MQLNKQLKPDSSVARARRLNDREVGRVEVEQPAVLHRYPVMRSAGRTTPKTVRCPRQIETTPDADHAVLVNLDLNRSASSFRASTRTVARSGDGLT